jgi:uncharacterized protein
MDSNNVSTKTMSLSGASYRTKPRIPSAHLFDANGRSMLLSVTSGLIYELDDIFADTLDRTMEFGDDERAIQLMAAAGFNIDTRRPAAAPTSIPVQALSLAVAQKCNLGCTYCYAQQGSFGGNDRNMPDDVAKASVDRLLKGASPGKPVSLAFLGGEPLVNRSVLQATTQYAAEQAALAGTEIRFSLTTNGTLLTAEDAEFFDEYGFAVTISVDGIGKKHDLLRPFKSGEGSFKRVIERAKLLLDFAGRRFTVTARVSVTPHNLDLSATLQELVALGFDSVMFSPVLSSPSGANQMAKDDFDEMLSQMIECGETFEQHLLNDRIYPFTNLISTLQRIHSYSREESYPCGAGGGYMGVSSEGGLYACHRFVDDDKGEMGTIIDGVDEVKQSRWLAERNVNVQEPCRTCWARHMCGGGCHYEAIHSGRPACDYIRGWLHYCLSVYANLLRLRPSLLDRILNHRVVTG